MIETADEGGVVGWKAAMAGLADIGIHIAAIEERPVVESDRLAPDPDGTDAVEAREEAGTATLERRYRVGFELGEGPG